MLDITLCLCHHHQTQSGLSHSVQVTHEAPGGCLMSAEVMSNIISAVIIPCQELTLHYCVSVTPSVLRLTWVSGDIMMSHDSHDALAGSWGHVT